MNQKDVALSFLKNAASGNLDEAYALVSNAFRHHNPHFKGDAESLKAGMADAHKKFPNTTLEVQHAWEMATWSQYTHGSHTDRTSPTYLSFTFSGLKAIASPSCGMWEWKLPKIHRTRMECSEVGPTRASALRP